MMRQDKSRDLKMKVCWGRLNRIIKRARKFLLIKKLITSLQFIIQRKMLSTQSKISLRKMLTKFQLLLKTLCKFLAERQFQTFSNKKSLSLLLKRMRRKKKATLRAEEVKPVSGQFGQNSRSKWRTSC